MTWALLLLGCADPALRIEGDPVAGRALWDGECSLCHGVDGEGSSRGSALVGVLDREPARDVLRVIRTGSGSMPAYGSELDDVDLADLLALLEVLGTDGP